ncbi:hypothetical protein HYU06_07290 [Candidatus Woesearchaeota archaeon]|nr:hypothetical protein [Candidatus Woesearchaeota archaeon]
MDYTTITRGLRVDLGRQISDDATHFYLPQRARENVTYFSAAGLGINPYSYQHLVFREIEKTDRLMICKSRQIGVSMAFAIFALWACHFNKFSSGIHKNTKIVIISRSDQAAKKLTQDIKKLIWVGDKKMAEKLDGEKHFFSNFLEPNPKLAANTKYQISWKDGSFVKCFPPTDSSRGETANVIIVDEAAFVEDEIFRDVIEPIVSATGGKIILGSTPNGQHGFYYELFDPFDTMPEHEYNRIWYKWDICENPTQLKVIKQKYEAAKRDGNMRSFDQEFNAMFTVDEQSFFIDEDVEKNVDETLALQYEWKKSPCIIGYDYGVVKSATVISVVTKIDDRIILLWQYARKDLDDNLLTDPGFEHCIQNLYKRYNVSKIVVDDCIQGNRTNKEFETMGYDVLRYNFRSDSNTSDRNRGYYLFRAQLKRYRIKYPRIPELLIEMKMMQEIQLKVITQVKAPKGYNDDRVDSFMLAAYPFIIDDDYNMQILTTEAAKTKKQLANENNPRYDKDWDTYFSGEGKGLI